MQRVVRSTLVGLLAVAGLTACGDKVSTTNVTITTTPPPIGTVHSVTVSPATVTVGVGATAQLAASVDADASITDRTVKWSSSDNTVATVSTSGLVTGVKAGSVTIIASANAAPTVQGAAAVTVGGGNGAVPTVTISSLNTTICAAGTGCASVPANLQNFGTGSASPANQTGQLDVILNVDAGGAVLKSVTSTLKCGTDSLTQSQTISGAAAPIGAEASSAPVTFSFNTTQFNSTTGVAAVHNGTCSISASAATAAGTQSATSSQSLTLNNADAVFGAISATKGPASDAAGLSWVAGDVSVKVTPVFYTTGRSAVSAVVTLTGAGSTQSITTFPGTATFLASKAAGANGGVKGITVNPLGATVTFVDNTGNNFALAGNAFSNAATLGPTRLDNQAPSAGAYVFNTQNATNNWVGTNFAFNTSAGNGYTAAAAGDNGGVGGVTVAFQYTTSPATSSSTWTTVTSGSAIPNSPNLTNADYTLRMVETDALGNATTTTLPTFGVDKNIPLAAFSGGASSNAASTTAAGAGGNFVIAYSDSISGFNVNPVLTTLVRNFELSATAGDCVVGVWDATNKVCKTANTTGTVAVDGGSGTNGYYTLNATVVDQAGNAAPTLTRSVVIDNTAPTSTSGVAIPATITGGSSVSFTAPFSDNLDLISSDGSVVYPNVTITYAGALDNPGTAFDNVLTKSANASLTITNFISAMQQTDGADAPTTASAKPTNVNIRASDEVGNFGANAVALPPANVVNGSGAADFTTAQFATFTESNAAKNISNGNNPGNIATTVDLTASIVGSTSTQNNPFTQVCFYYQQTQAGQSNTGEWVLIGCQSAASVTDNPAAPAATGRTWLYTLSAWNPPSGLGTATAAQLRAIGLNSKGNGISTNTNANVTLVP